MKAFYFYMMSKLSFGWRRLSPSTFRGKVVLVIVMLFLLLPGCNLKKGDETEKNLICAAGQWAQDTDGSFAYTHDCNPFSSTHFTVYSDGSSTNAKQFLANLVEEVFGELVQEFLIQDIQEELRFTPGYTYYIYAQKYTPNIMSMGYRNGFFIPAIDCAVYPGIYENNQWSFRCTVKHEVTHVIQFTLTNCPRNTACPLWLGFWFREGQAECMSGKGESRRISTLAEYNEWIADPGHANPISIHRWSDFPDQSRFSEYYVMFALAYYYLLDPQGYGATINEMRQLFQLMAEGVSFHDAFAAALNMTIEFYRDNYYEMIEAYLTAKEQANFVKSE